MKIKTRRFGIIEIDENKIINMPKGMPGFPGRKRFIMFRHREDSPFYWYQCIEDRDLAFVIMSPFIIKPDYRIDVDYIVSEMQWNESSDKENLEIYVIINIPRGAPEKMTANLIAPLVINTRNREAGQIILSDSPYDHRYPVIPEKGTKKKQVRAEGNE